MATYLAVPLKKTWEVDLAKPLRTFISSTFSSSDATEYSSGLTEFNKLRSSIISKSVDKHESSLDVFYRYYDQLVANESKFPIAENQIRIEFKWQDAFQKESFFTGRRTLSVASSNYEKVCVLFNIGALQSQIACTQNPSSDDGLKTAARLFQQACGVFSHLKDCVLSHVQSDPTPDLHPDTLGALASLMLAQAQDCFCRKAIADKMKPVTIAKVAHQVSDFYADALKLLQLGSIRDLWPRDWISSVAGKQAGYHALAEYYMSMGAKQTKDFGMEIARLKHAKDLMIAAETRAGNTFVFQSLSQHIRRSLDEANKDNDFIYHAKIPETTSLPGIGKAVVAKIMPFSTPMSSNFSDLFEKVVPLAVNQALNAFENRKAEVINAQISKIREQTQLLNSVLASLNLPAAIEDLSGNAVPSSLLEKSAKVRELGGVEKLSKLMSDLPELLTRNREILDESMKLLAEEEASDRQLRNQFKDRWTRTPSDKLTEPIKAEGNKYRTIIDNAIRADHIVKERFGVHSEGITLLSRSDSEILNALPHGSPAAALQGSPCVDELRTLMGLVEALKTEREVMESELKGITFDMSNRFLHALAADGAINEENLSQSELDRTYGPLRAQVLDSVTRQQDILANVERSNVEFCQAKSQNKSASEREKKLKDLAAAYDSFMELRANLQEGTKFYNDLTQLLVKFQSKAQDFCFARKTEKDELMKDLQTKIVNQPATSPPSAPTYQQPTEEPSTRDPGNGEGPKVPPPRPPPPSRPPAPTVPPAPEAVQPQQPPQRPQQMPQGQQPYGRHQQKYPSATVREGVTKFEMPRQKLLKKGRHQQNYPSGGYTPYAPPPQGYQGQQPNAPYPGYGAATPYPVAPPGGYAPPVMPQGYNPYNMQYSYPPQGYPQYPGYPGYPQQGGYR